jgi:hypothetical protein
MRRMVGGIGLLLVDALAVAFAIVLGVRLAQQYPVLSLAFLLVSVILAMMALAAVSGVTRAVSALLTRWMRRLALGNEHRRRMTMRLALSGACVTLGLLLALGFGA